MSFLYSWLTKKPSSQGPKFDRISFHVNLSDNIPQFYETNAQKGAEEQEITPDHPLYYQIFPKEQDKCIEYIANENDTLFGIAIKLNISQKRIRQMNDLSGNIYPGMKIKLPEGTDIEPLFQKEVEQQKRMRISEILTTQSNNKQNIKYDCYYIAGNSGNVKGTLTINENYIIFNPSLQSQENLQRFNIQKLLKFNVIIQTIDIQEALLMDVPQTPEQQSADTPKIKSVIQFMLYKVGNARIQTKYKQRLKQLKIDRKAIASISFTFTGQKCHQDCQEIVNVVKNNVLSIGNSKNQKDQTKRLTSIPFFDIIHQNINPKAKQQVKQQKKILTQSTIFGTLNDQSSIISPERFSHLVKRVPILYQLYSWNKVYSSVRDGTSFYSFMNKGKNAQPSILLVKQYKGNILGAYLTDPIQTGKSGRGQMFIFRYKGDSPIPQIYEWTTKNEFFVYLEKQSGIGIGMGLLSYGIYLRNTFEKGSSYPTITFGNTERLSEKQDFQISCVELWSIDTS